MEIFSLPADVFLARMRLRRPFGSQAHVSQPAKPPGKPPPPFQNEHRRGHL